VSNLAALDPVEETHHTTRLAASKHLMDAFIEEACSPGRLGYNGDNVFDTAFKQVPTIHLPETQDPTLFGKRHSCAPSINNASPPTTTNDLAVGNTPKRIRSGSLKAIRHYAALPFQQLTSNKECNTKGRSSGETVGPTLTVKRKHLSLPTAPYLLQLASPLLRQQYGGPRKKDDPSLWLCADLRRQFCVLSPSMEDIDPMDDDDDDTQAAMNEEIQKYFPMLGSDATVNAGKSTLLCETTP
jgi:sterol 3beta-glucosyltransferase